MLSLPRSLHYSFLSLFISSNEWDLTIYISSNEWDLKGGTTVHLISMRTRCFYYCRKSFFFLSLQMNEILRFISLQLNEIFKVELQFISSQCALDVSIIVGNPEVRPIIFRVKTYNPPDFSFYRGKLNKKATPYGTLLLLSLFSPQQTIQKKANIVNNIAVISSDSYQTKLSVESRDSRTVILSDRNFISHQTTIVDYFYCTVYIILFKNMHALLN